MTAVVRILCGPAGSGKTGRLAERYRERVRSEFGTALWLGPTHRAVEALRPRLLDGLPGCLAPHLFTFQDFAEEVIRVNDPSARPLSHLQRRLLADDLVAELHARGQLSHFHGVVETRGFAETVFALLAELKQHEIRPDRFARAVAEGGELFGVKDRQCSLLYSEYQGRLGRHHLFDLEGRFWYARDLLAGGARRPFERLRAVFVDGFTDFTRTQRDVLAALAGWVKELWVTLPDEPGDERAELFTRPRATLARLRDLNPVVDYLPATEGPRGANGIRCPVIPPPKSLPLSAPEGRASKARAGRSRKHAASAAPPGLIQDCNPPPSQGLTPLATVCRPSGAESPFEPVTLPAGLAHIERQLFRPPRAVRAAEDADGILCIEAPGTVGEARLVARHIASLLREGVRADDVLVAVRDLPPYADLVREVFAEYGIPVDVEGAEPLHRNPAVATLLRTVRLPDEGWAFAPVTALLRSGYFRPDWPEVRDCPDIAQHAEALLRLLAEPRSREAYLKAVHRWAEAPQPGLEDEQAEESHRRRTHELARKCRPFLDRFFHAWDDAPPTAALSDHAAWLRRLADDLGITRAAAEDPRDAAALGRFWDELGQWVRVEGLLHGGARVLDRGHLFRTLAALAGEAGLARSPRGPGQVRVLSAALARGLEVPYLYVMGLGERSFPRLAAPEAFFDEPERQSFKQAGLDFPCVADLLADEMLLFYQLVTRARRRLVLSYPAVDEKGQDLLPSSFLAALLDCFTPGAVPRQQRRMLIERYDRDPPLSPAEYRVRAALGMAAGPGPFALPGDLAANLAAAADLVRQRFHQREHTPYDGLLRDPSVIADLQKMFGPERILSPTALEGYIACPFRFFLDHVLGLEPLEEPSEEVEGTERGLAFHRALSRLHTRLNELGIDQPAEAVEGHLMERLDEAVNECAVRASPASEVLWRLEGQRLRRVARRYRPHWARFIEPWLPRGVRPRPYLFEVGFGLPGQEGETPAGPLVINLDGLEVRVSGRIDRVDVAELPDETLGFWIIDYKTGRSSHYTGGDLKEFRRLQLTLYALAAEQVLLADRRARPLGLAYWLVTDSGPKVALPAYPRHLAWFEETGAWRKVREQLQRWVVTLVVNIRQGQFPLKPRSEHCTQSCDFGQVCRISQSRTAVENKTWQLPLPVV
jgi:ATP-dependent helicase/DNAse subunit B